MDAILELARWSLATADGVVAWLAVEDLPPLPRALWVYVMLHAFLGLGALTMHRLDGSVQGYLSAWTRRWTTLGQLTRRTRTMLRVERAMWPLHRNVVPGFVDTNRFRKAKGSGAAGLWLWIRSFVAFALRPSLLNVGVWLVVLSHAAPSTLTMLQRRGIDLVRFVLDAGPLEVAAYVGLAIVLVGAVTGSPVKSLLKRQDDLVADASVEQRAIFKGMFGVSDTNDTNVDRLSGQLEHGDFAARLVECVAGNRFDYVDGRVVPRTSSLRWRTWSGRPDSLTEGYRSPDEAVAALSHRLTGITEKGLDGALAKLNRPYAYELAQLGLTPFSVRHGIRVLSPERVQAIFDSRVARCTDSTSPGQNGLSADELELQIEIMTERLRTLLADAVEYSLRLDATLDRWRRRQRRGALASLAVRAVGG